MRAKLPPRVAAFRPRIRTVLLFVNVVILLLPLLGIQALKLYENELIRQTEAALFQQGAFVREQFKHAVLARLEADGRALDVAAERYGIPVLPRFVEPERPDDASRTEFYAPLTPTLDLARETVRPPAEEGKDTGVEPDPVAAAAGAPLSVLLQNAQRYTLAGVRVVDHKGIVVASSRGEIGQSLYHREEVMRALTGETLSLLRERVSDEPMPPLEAISRGNRVRVFVALPVVHEGQALGAVLLSRTPLDLEKALYLNRFVLLRYSVGLIVIVLLVSIVTATTISRPIHALIEQTDRIRGDDPAGAAPIAHPGSHELQRLSEAIAAMARALRERAAYIEAFARNVSHEFKTPLATFQGTVELLRDHLDTMTRAERDRFLGMLAGDAQRMEKLVTRLLQLARADTLSPGEGRSEVLRVAQTTAERFRVPVEAGEGVATLKARIAPEALDSVLGNLLENARHHGGPAVKVAVAVERAELGGAPAVLVRVADDGPGISPANLAKAFDAFFTTARETGGTGLGLSIVRSLVEAHGGTVTLASEGVGKGVTVRVVLPLEL